MRRRLSVNGAALLLERVSDRTLPVIQVAPRTLQDSLFALNFQGKAVFLLYIGGNLKMERTEIVSLYKNTPADGTVVTV